MKIEVFYDKQCPFCNMYANYLHLKDNHDLILINARENIYELKKLKKRGFDIDEGFVIRIDDKYLYQGSNAVAFLDEISKRKLYIFDNIFFKVILYPIIKAFRKAVLFILGKDIDILK